MTRCQETDSAHCSSGPPHPGLDELMMNLEWPDYLRSAYSDLLVAEIPGFDHEERILQYHAATTLQATTDEVPWCSSYCCFHLWETGYESTWSAAARSWLALNHHLEVPQFGALAIFKRGQGQQPGADVLDAPGHVGFWVGFASDSRHLILGGNQGNKVSIQSYRHSRLLGLRLPDRRS